LPPQISVWAGIAWGSSAAGNRHPLLPDLKLLGFLFESLVIRDLRVYAQACDGVVLQYRDSEGLEVDAVIETGDGRWAAFEIKLGSSRVDEGASNLLKFSKQMDTKRCGEPAALGVIVGNGHGYRREDGVQVIPIGAAGSVRAPRCAVVISIAMRMK
jgi:predicted AAA+ superfamily ATPase